MKNTKFVSIKTVLFDLSQVLDDRYWNESKAIEWATKAFRSLNIETKFKEMLCALTLENHTTQLPKDFHSQIIVFDSNRKAYTNTSVINTSTCADSNTCRCDLSYSIDENLVLTSNVKDAKLFVVYNAYITDIEGYHLIPDREEVKEAVLAYVLWKYWTSKWLMKEEGSESRMMHFKSEWSIYSKKALNLNNPDIPQMENIMRRFSHIVPRQNEYAQLFSTLAAHEDVAK